MMAGGSKHRTNTAAELTFRLKKQELSKGRPMHVVEYVSRDTDLMRDLKRLFYSRQSDNHVRALCSAEDAWNGKAFIPQASTAFGIELVGVFRAFIKEHFPERAFLMIDKYGPESLSSKGSFKNGAPQSQS